MRQVENLAELPVPADQRQILVEYRDALAHMIERGLQNLAIVVDRRIRIVEKLQRRLGRNSPLAQQSDSTSREDAAPIADANRYSPYCSS